MPFVSSWLPRDWTSRTGIWTDSQIDTVSMWEGVRSGLRGRFEVARLDRAGEVLSLMAAVAEGLIARMSATADADGLATGQSEDLPLLVNKFKIAFDTNRAVIEDSHFGCRHKFLRQDAPQNIGCGEERQLEQHRSTSFAALDSRLVARNVWIDFRGPGQYAAAQIQDFAETGLAKEVHGLGGTLAAAAMRDDLMR